ncbi:MAG: protocatechuate 3,4-dioxygenase subunit alpha [Devosia sp.]
MPQPLNLLKETPSQTAGPYVHIGLTPNFCDITGVYPNDLGTAMVDDQTKGERVTVTGRIFDGTGTPLRDGLVEIWQADASGRYPGPTDPRGGADPHFTGWGRCAAHGETGVYRFDTIKPGRVPWPDGRLQAPHISFWIVARGINLGLNTRLYFPEESAANAEDPLLKRLEHQARVPTLVGKREGQTITFDIHLQGPQETIFFDI